MKILSFSVRALHHLPAMKNTVTKADLPTRPVVLSKLASLADGGLSPENASKWAEVWLLADQTPGTKLQIEDWPVWEALKLIAGADLQVEPGSYLYGIADFQDWLETLRAAPLSPERPATR